MEYINDTALEQFIQSALLEDIREGDHTSLAAIPKESERKAQLLIKGEGIVAGLALAEKIFKTFDADLELEMLLADGASVKYGDIGFYITGSARSILSTERLVLNCMQRMSGIATYTHQLKGLLAGTKAKLLDTRKTTPNFRLCEKWAVVIGGGTNHRFGLFDMIMLKDNHNDYAGGISKAVKATQKYLHEKNLDLKVEVETRNLNEVKEALEVGGVDRIMLDNMSPETMNDAISLINGKCETEASGGITEKTIRKVAQTGVDYISVGALTHSVKSMDISLKAVK